MKIFMTFLCFILNQICELTHHLPEKQEDKLQGWFVEIIGYHCPFSIWSYKINEKYNLAIWKKPTFPASSDTGEK